MPSARRRELLDVAAALVVDPRRGAKCAVELTKLLKSDGYAAPAAADAVAELAHLDDSLAAFVSLMYTSRDFACQARVASMLSTLVARAGLDEGDAGRAFESVDKGGLARLVLAARRVESPVAFARDVCSFVRAFNAAKGREATGVTMTAATTTRVMVGRARLECPAVAFNGDEGFCLVAAPRGGRPERGNARHVRVRRVRPRREARGGRGHDVRGSPRARRVGAVGSRGRLARRWMDQG